MIKITIEPEYLEMLYNLLSQEQEFLSLNLRDKKDVTIEDIGKISELLKKREISLSNLIQEKRKAVESILLEDDDKLP